MNAHRICTIFTSPSLLLAASILTSAALAADPSDWPQYRGPNRDGISSESGWSVEGREANLWEVRVGRGYSAVTVSNGRLYTMGFDEDGGMDVVWCLDPKTGEELWAHPYPAKIWNQFHGGGTLTTPSVDGDRVFVMNREGKFMCLDAETGEEFWMRDLIEEWKVTPPTWGFSASPLVLDDMLILNVGPTVALDKKTGETLWKTEDMGHAYATPIDFELEGRPCLAAFGGLGLYVLDRTKGEILFKHEWRTQYDVNASTPIVIGDKLFISSGYGHGGSLISLAGAEPKVLWENKAMKTQMSGAVLVGEHIYGFDDAILKCIDQQGEVLWSERGLGNGALIGADGKLMIVTGKGELLVAAANPEKFEALSKTKVLDDGAFWTTPTLANGLVYCRSSLGQLVCRDHRSPTAKD
jgi:outer membrane protein assembly factor BamB